MPLELSPSKRGAPTKPLEEKKRKRATPSYSLTIENGRFEAATGDDFLATIGTRPRKDRGRTGRTNGKFDFSRHSDRWIIALAFGFYLEGQSLEGAITNAILAFCNEIIETSQFVYISKNNEEFTHDRIQLKKEPAFISHIRRIKAIIPKIAIISKNDGILKIDFKIALNDYRHLGLLLNFCFYMLLQSEKAKNECNSVLGVFKTSLMFEPFESKETIEAIHNALAKNITGKTGLLRIYALQEAHNKRDKSFPHQPFIFELENMTINFEK